jgi:hypothetical protein
MELPRMGNETIWINAMTPTTKKWSAALASDKSDRSSYPHLFSCIGCISVTLKKDEGKQKMCITQTHCLSGRADL